MIRRLMAPSKNMVPNFSASSLMTRNAMIKICRVALCLFMANVSLPSSTLLDISMALRGAIW